MSAPFWHDFRSTPPRLVSVAAAVAILFMTACTGHAARTTAPPDATAVPTLAPTSLATASTSPVDPRTLFGLLQRTPFAGGELTSGWTADSPHLEASGGPPGALGAVGVKLRGSMPPRSDFTVIVYGVFSTPAAARAAFAQGPAAVLDPRDHRLISSAPIAAIGGPTTMSHVQVTDIHGGGQPVAGYSYCTALAGDVVVSGGAGNRGAQQSGDDATACRLTKLAITHLDHLNGKG